MSNHNYDLLIECPIFKGLPSPEIKKKLSQIRHQFVSFQKNKILALRGDPIDELLVLLNGSIKAEMMDMEGRSLEIEVITPKSPIAPAFILSSNNVFPVDLVALEKVSLLIIPKKALINLLHSDKDIMTNFLKIISNKAYFLSERLYIMSFKNIKQKLGFYLLNLKKKSGSDSFKLPRSITDLSQYFGVSRPSLSRVLGEMENLGMIRSKNKQITILDTKLLETLVEE